MPGLGQSTGATDPTCHRGCPRDGRGPRVTRIAAQLSPACSPEALERLLEDGRCVKPLRAGAVCYSVTENQNREHAGTAPQTWHTPCSSTSRPSPHTPGPVVRWCWGDRYSGPWPQGAGPGSFQLCPHLPAMAGLWETRGRRQGAFPSGRGESSTSHSGTVGRGMRGPRYPSAV